MWCTQVLRKGLSRCGPGLRGCWPGLLAAVLLLVALLASLLALPVIQPHLAPPSRGGLAQDCQQPLAPLDQALNSTSEAQAQATAPGPASSAAPARQPDVPEQPGALDTTMAVSMAVQLVGASLPTRVTHPCGPFRQWL